MENLQEECTDKQQGKQELSVLRQRNRARAFWFMSVGLRKGGLMELAYCLGASLVAPGWKKLPTSQVAERDCWLVPLPELCPLGWTGFKCDQCAVGFTGAGCSECLPKYYGPYCQYCDCGKGGLCHVQQGRVFCKCKIDFYGENCSTAGKLVPEGLLKEPTFLKINNLLNKEAVHGEFQSSVWGKWKDGCISYNKDGSVLLSSDGVSSCGLGQELLLSNQPDTDKIVCSATLTVANGSFIENEASARLCLHIDSQFMDSTHAWGTRSCFYAFDAGDQEEHVLLDFKKPLDWIHVFIIMTGMRASVTVHNVNCFKMFTT